jgi:hypothetical protein
MEVSLSEDVIAVPGIDYTATSGCTVNLKLMVASSLWAVPSMPIEQPHSNTNTAGFHEEFLQHG